MRKLIVRILVLMFVLYLGISFGYSTKAMSWPDFGVMTRGIDNSYANTFFSTYQNGKVSGYKKGELDVGESFNTIGAGGHDKDGFFNAINAANNQMTKYPVKSFFDIIESITDTSGQEKGKAVNTNKYWYAGQNHLFKMDEGEIIEGTTYKVVGKYIIHGNQLLSLDSKDNVKYESIDYSNAVFANCLATAMNGYWHSDVGETLSDDYKEFAELAKYYWNDWIENGADLATYNRKLLSKLSTDKVIEDYNGSLSKNVHPHFKVSQVEAYKTWTRQIGKTQFVDPKDQSKEKEYDLWLDENDEFEEENITIKADGNNKKIGSFCFDYDGAINENDSYVKIVNKKNEDQFVKKSFNDLGLEIISGKTFNIKLTSDSWIFGDNADLEIKFHVVIEAKIEGIQLAGSSVLYILQSNNESPNLVAAHSSPITYNKKTVEKDKSYDLNPNNTKLKVVSWLYKELKDDGTYESKSKLKDVEFMVFYSKTEIDLDDDDTKCKYVYYDEDNGKYKLSSNTNKISKYKNFNATNLPDKSLLTTNSKGELTLTGLEPGYYYVKQLSSYSKNGEPLYCYTGKIQKVYIPKGKSKSVKLVSYYNVGKLKIIKTDDNGNAWENIEFEIAYQLEKDCGSDGTATCGNAYHTVCDKDNFYYFVKEDRKKTDSYVSYDEDTGDTLYSKGKKVVATNSKGRITLSKLYAGEYKITEKNLPEGYVMCVYKDGKWQEITGTSYTLEIKPGKTTTIKIQNKRKNIKLGGYVWEENSNNNLYDGKTKDKTFEGITVQLVDSTDTTKDFAKQTTTKADGSYEFEDVEYANLSKYYIRFIYDGFTYNTVSLDTNKANGSKGTENEDDRDNLNNKFKFVTGLESNNVSGTTTTVNAVSTADKTLALKYNTVAGQNGSADIATYTNEQWTYKVEQNKPTTKIAERKAGEYDVSAKATITIPSDNRTTKIDNINLGLKQREQPDLKIENNLYSVTKSINNQTETYTEKLDEKMEVLASDIKTLHDPEFKDQYLKIFLTYKITITNETDLNMKIYEVIGNCPGTESYKLIDKKNEDKDSLYEGVTISSENNNELVITSDAIQLREKESKNIYVQVEIKKDVIKNMYNSEFNTLSEIKVDNIVEINKYSTHDENGNLYAGLDKDSAVGNKTYFTKEDDTSVNNITFLPESEYLREISGNVFEDLPIVNTNKERLGNGTYDSTDDSTEKSIKDVLVELVPVKTDEEKAPYVTVDNGHIGESKVAYVYNASGNTEYLYSKNIDDSNTSVGKKCVAAVLTDDEGSYSFKGVLPGTYIIRFVWGDSLKLEINDVIEKKVVFNDKKTSITDGKNITVQDYKSTIRVENWTQDGTDNRYSDALDNYEKRQAINKDLSNISYDVVESYESKNYNLNADTDNIVINIGTRKMNNVDFGLIERPKQDIQVIKEISNVKLTLANNHAIVNGPTNSELPYTTYLKQEGTKGGTLKIELDNELIHGSNVEVVYNIKIKNLSELDYNNEEYYKTGKNKENQVNTEIKQIVDYMENDGFIYADSLTTDKWTSLSNSEFVDKIRSRDIQLSTNAEKEAKELKNVLLLKDEVSIMPGEEKQVSIFASKTLGSSEKEISYRNDVEVIKIYNSVGRFMSSSTPGNYVINENNDEKDNDYINFTIIPPTGQTRIYYVLGITSLLIILIGIVIIKKKVLD